MIHGLKSRIIESALTGEIEHHLSPQAEFIEEAATVFRNRRNGYTGKIIKTNSGDLPF